jgi:hypothetical protein
LGPSFRPLRRIDWEEDSDSDDGEVDLADWFDRKRKVSGTQTRGPSKVAKQSHCSESEEDDDGKLSEQDDEETVADEAEVLMEEDEDSDDDWEEEEKPKKSSSSSGSRRRG